MRTFSVSLSVLENGYQMEGRVRKRIDVRDGLSWLMDFSRTLGMFMSIPTQHGTPCFIVLRSEVEGSSNLLTARLLGQSFTRT